MADLGMAFMAPVLANQEYVQKQEMQPAELVQKAASTRYTSAMADRLEQENAGDRKVAAMMVQAAGSPPQEGGSGSVSEKLLAQSDMWARAGMPTKATQLAEAAAQAQAHEATARTATIQGKLKDFTLQKGQVEQVTKLLGGVKDADSWQEANSAFEQQTGQKSPFADTPYDPKLVKLLQDSTMSSYQRQMLAMRDAALKADVTNKASEIQSRATGDAIKMERLRVYQQRAKRQAKEGGKDVGSPSKVEVEAAGRLVGDKLDGDDKDSASFSIASEARAIRKRNPGVSSDEALRQAALNAQQNGSFVPGKPSRIPFIGKPGPGKFVVPQSLPTSQKASDLVTGQHYKWPSGKVYEWTGDKKSPWKDVGGGKVGSGKGGPASDSDDEGVEDAAE